MSVDLDAIARRHDRDYDGFGGEADEDVGELLAEVDRLLEENRRLRREAVGITEDGRTVTDLEAKIKRLEGGVRQHRDSSQELDEACFFLGRNGPTAEDVLRIYRERDRRLWALLDEETT